MTLIELAASEFINWHRETRRLREERRKAFRSCDNLDRGPGGILEGTLCLNRTVPDASGLDLRALDPADYCAQCKLGVALGKAFQSASRKRTIAMRRLEREVTCG